jgi:hypothetical protein
MSLIVLLTLCFLSISTLALNPTISKNYFFVNSDNYLSYELYQTRNGIVSHSIDNFASRYILINLSTKDASPILSDIVRTCDVAAVPPFPQLHYHVQTDSLVYFCATNNSLLLIDQSNYTVQNVIPLLFETYWSCARLSTDGMNIAILTMDSLFSTNPQSSALFKIDMQTQQISTRILLDQNFTKGEAVVAYAAGKQATYIATNKIQDQNFITTVYSIAFIGTTYQLTPVNTFTLTNRSENIITKLFSVGDSVVVNNGADIYFLNQQGKTLQSASTRLKSITIDNPIHLYHPSFTALNGGTCLFIQQLDGSVGKFTAYGTAIILFKLPDGPFADMQIAYGNSTMQDLIFTIDDKKQFFKIWNSTQTFKTIYTAVAGYSDLMLTDTTYAVVHQNYSALSIFDLKNDSLLYQVPLGSNNYYYNKDQQILSFPHLTADHGCRLSHVDLVSGRTWDTLYLETRDYYCESVVVNARVFENRNPAVVLSFSDHYLILSEKSQMLTFRTPLVDANFANLNINFDDTSFYYLISEKARNQVNASFYTLNSQSREFQLQKTQLFESVPVNSKDFFNVNSTMSVALSNNNFAVLDKLDSPISYTVPNNYNLATSFQDASGNQYVLLAYYGAQTPKASVPELFATYGDFVSLPGLRLNTVSGRATGAKSFALHDDLYQAVGLIRFYNASASTDKKDFISI